MELLRTLGPPVVAAIAAVLADRAMERRGLLPPRFAGARLPLPASLFTIDGDRAAAPMGPDARLRRVLGTSVLALILWVACFAPIATLGEPPPDTVDLTIPRLFALHGVLVAALLTWYALGYLPRLRPAGDRDEEPPLPAMPGAPYGEPPSLEPPPSQVPSVDPTAIDPLDRRLPRPDPTSWDWRAAFALGGRPGHELAVGIGVGLAIWMGVLAILLLLAGLVSLLGGREALPQQPPTMVLWIGALPFWARAAVALSAGLVEEVFFRGFLQLRIGALASTALFALVHLGYGQPFMLVGVTLLSLLYADLLRRRGSVWAPIAAHAVFDLVQLLVVVPLVAKALEHQSGATEVATMAATALGMR